MSPGACLLSQSALHPYPRNEQSLSLSRQLCFSYYFYHPPSDRIPPPHPTFQCQDLSSRFRGLLHKRDGKQRDCDAGENDNRDQSRAAGTCFLRRSPSLSRSPSGFPCDQPLPPSRVLSTRSTSNGPELLPSQRVAGEM